MGSGDTECTVLVSTLGELASLTLEPHSLRVDLRALAEDRFELGPRLPVERGERAVLGERPQRGDVEVDALPSLSPSARDDVDGGPLLVVVEHHAVIAMRLGCRSSRGTIGS